MELSTNVQLLAPAWCKLALSCIAVWRLLLAAWQTLSLCVDHQRTQCSSCLDTALWDRAPEDVHEEWHTQLESALCAAELHKLCCVSGHMFWQRGMEAKFS